MPNITVWLEDVSVINRQSIAPILHNIYDFGNGVIFIYMDFYFYIGFPSAPFSSILTNLSF